MAFLELNKIVKAFGGLMALRELNLDVQQGEILGLIGPNGSGKTTTFNVISGFLKPDKGEVIYGGKNITGLHPHVIAELGIIRTFQLTMLFLDLTVLDNVLIGLHKASSISFLHSLFNTRANRRKDKELLSQATEILQLTELEDQKYKLANDLSAGWRKTLAIAIALAAKPRLLLLDEPVCTLSPARVSSIMELVAKLRKSGMTVVLIEHNMKVIMDHCDRIAVLNFGEKLAEGPPKEVQQDKRVIDAYLGA